MAEPNVLILRAPGTNCDVETAFAFQKAGAKAQRVHINRLLEGPDLLGDFQILCIPGGFSYGDDVAAGRILANQIQHHLAEQMVRFKAAGNLILGICNGFQVLLKSGVLLDGDPRLGQPATVAHAEGKFVARDAEALQQLEAGGQLVLRYSPLDAAAAGRSESAGWVALPYPDNPNGSVANVAGICDGTGRVLGLMPHPERHVDPTHHPRWTRGEAGPVGDGLQVFVNAVAYFS
jgi:phosphoribosylformylglycinamidine (FGAM) synthase-like amidotransferase family enzyme